MLDHRRALPQLLPTQLAAASACGVTRQPAAKRKKVAKLTAWCEGFKGPVQIECAEDDDVSFVRQMVSAKVGKKLSGHAVHAGTLKKPGPALYLAARLDEAGLEDGATIVIKKRTADAGAPSGAASGVGGPPRHLASQLCAHPPRCTSLVPCRPWRSSRTWSRHCSSSRSSSYWRSRCRCCR